MAITPKRVRLLIGAVAFMTKPFRILPFRSGVECVYPSVVIDNRDLAGIAGKPRAVGVTAVTPVPGEAATRAKFIAVDFRVNNNEGQ